MKKTLAILIIMLFTLPLLAQKRAFTIEDLYRIKGVGDPQISPDGKSIAFVVTEYQFPEGESNADIYVVDIEGGQPRRLTYSTNADYHPRWSPDGKTLMFVSTRKDGPQVWLLPVNGGEPRQLTTISSGVADPIWSPDGRRIVFATEVFPEYGADDTLNRRDSQAMEEGPIQAHMADRLLYRHWTSWADGKRTHTFVIDVESGDVRDLTPGDFNAPRFSLGGRGYAISPDGKELCVVSNHDPDPWSSTNADLWVVPLDGGEMKNITDGNEAYDGDPLYSPDGRTIAFLKQAIPRYEADRFRIALYDRKTETIRTTTQDFDNWVSDFAWTPDSRFLFFTAGVKGHVPLYRVDVKSGKIMLVVDAKTIDSFSLSSDGKWIALTRRSVGEPTELFRVDTNGKTIKKLSFLNAPVQEEVDIRPAEEMWVEGGEGAQIQVFIVKPHDFDPEKKYPLILNVHGGPQMMWADAFRSDWQVYPGAGYVVAFPNPHGSTGYGQDFTAQISSDWGGMVFEDVMKVTDALAALSYVDEERMGAMGWSYGGYLIMWFEGHTDRFKALASMMGVYDLRSMYGATEELWFPEWDLKGQPWNSEQYEKWSPSNFVENYKTPCLVITGERDYRVPYTQSLHFFTDLQKMEVPSRLIVFKNDGHWPSHVRSMPLYYNAHLDWFHKYLGGEPAPYDMTKMVRNRAFCGDE